jgi:hypothetical protein
MNQQRFSRYTPLPFENEKTCLFLIFHVQKNVNSQSKMASIPIMDLTWLFIRVNRRFGVQQAFPIHCE